MRRVVVAAVIAMALMPVSVGATPSPSPSLVSLLVPPPDGYVLTPTSPFLGHMSAHDYAETWGRDAASAEHQLSSYGMVDGYGMLWVDPSTRRQMIQFVLAFSGGSGATQWLGAESVTSRQAAGYKHADTITGIGAYYGVHATRSRPAGVVDAFEFVKGNDVFGISFFSTRDDVLELARTETKALYDASPASTIPESQWPETLRSAQRPGGDAFTGGEALFIGVVVVALILGVAAFVWMRRAEALQAAGPAAPKHQLSEDGQFWWAGNAWIATSEFAPTWAQRSPDGAYWWDGRSWRPDPQVMNAVQMR